MKIQLFIYITLFYINSAAASDLTNAPEASTNVIDLRSRNCVAGNLTDCSDGLKYFNTRRSHTPNGSCIIQQVDCGNKETRNDCYNSANDNIKNA